MENVLKNQKSRFLRRHADNPIAWQPYSESVFKEANKNNKPIYLSSGYSACHFCRLMEKESFEDIETAKYINENFIPVLIDKDEFPDIDKKYQFYLQSMGEAGGWPLNVFLTADGEPFYAGTYYPAKRSQDKPAFKDILKSINEIYTKKHDEVAKVIKTRHEFLESFEKPLEKELLEGDAAKKYIIEEYIKIFDDEFGGFRKDAKFPYVPALNFLIEKANDERILKFLIKTADALSTKPICDHLFGGFFRYTVDRKWMQPHFEKILSDNALISLFLIKMYNLTNNNLYLFTAKNAIDFIIHTLGSNFGLHNGVDADSKNQSGLLSEGHYYKVTDRDFSSLAEGELKNFPLDAGVENGVIYIKHNNYIKAAALAPTLNKIAKRIETVREAPEIDDKVISGANFLFCTALLECFEASGEDWYLSQATALFHKVRYILTEGGSVYRCSYDEAILNHRVLEDHVYFLETVIKFFEITKEKEFILIAKSVSEQIETDFVKNGKYYSDLTHTFSDSFDDDKPNAFSLYVNLATRYEHLLDNKLNDSTKKFAIDRVLRFPTGHPTLASVYDELEK